MTAGGTGGRHALVGFVPCPGRFGQGRPRLVRRSGALRAGLVTALMVLAGGCGGPVEGASTQAVTSSAPASAVAGESAFAREYARLHGVTRAQNLSVTTALQADIAAAIRSGYAGPVLLLPSVLPSGYGLAAPFRGTGSGAPLSNPHTWGSGYAVTYTDGGGRLTLVVHPDGPLASGEWHATGTTLDGLALLIQERGDLVLVSTAPGDDAQVIVIGERLPRAEVLRVAAGLVSAE